MPLGRSQRFSGFSKVWARVGDWSLSIQEFLLPRRAGRVLVLASSPRMDSALFGAVVVGVLRSLRWTGPRSSCLAAHGLSPLELTGDRSCASPRTERCRPKLSFSQGLFVAWYWPAALCRPTLLPSPLLLP